MSALTRWNPFRQLARLDSAAEFEDLFRSLGLRGGRDLEAAFEMRMDVTDEDEAFVVKVDVPGVRKEDIEIDLVGNQVSIRAEVNRGSQKKEGKAMHSERYCGTAFRSFTLPQDIDTDGAQAKYDGGVLCLTLPKKHRGNVRKLEIG
jgi:HSP20 family protein